MSQGFGFCVMLLKRTEYIQKNPTKNLSGIRILIGRLSWVFYTRMVRRVYQAFAEMMSV